MFAGFKFIFIGVLPGKQREEFSRQAIDFGATILTSRPAAIFGKRPLESDLTHVIVVDLPSISLEEVVKRLNCEIGGTGLDLHRVKVLSLEWLKDCLQSKKFLIEDSYLSIREQKYDNVDKLVNKKVKLNEMSLDIQVLSSSSSHSNQKIEVVSKEVEKIEDISVSDIVEIVISNETNCLQSVQVLDFNKEDIIFNSWMKRNSILYYLSWTPNPSEVDWNRNWNHRPVTCFDLDGTIIVPKSENKYSQNEFDWKLFDSSVEMKLLNLYENGHYIAIISNQGRLKKETSLIDQFKRKIEALKNKLKIPFDFICSLEDDIYRKPRPGMWEFLARSRGIPLTCSVGTRQYQYIGDAAGRPKEGCRLKDFSDSDRKFAYNCGFTFNTPEAFFLNSKARIHTILPKLSGILLSSQTTSYPIPETIFQPVYDLNTNDTSTLFEIILMVASPASGKTTLSRHFESLGYIRVNQDEMKSFDKCFSVAKDTIVNFQQSVTSSIATSTTTTTATAINGIVVDNTNMLPSVRSKWISLAKEYNVKIRCIIIRLSKEICFHLMAFRLSNPLTPPEDRRKIEAMVIHRYFKDPILPTISDGFDRIDEYSWTPTIPEDVRARRLFHSYLI